MHFRTAASAVAASARSRTRMVVAVAPQNRTRLNFSRTHWTAATSSHPDLATALSRCLPAPSSTSSVSPATTPSEAKDSVTIVLASRSYPGSDLLALPSKVPPHVAHTSMILGAVVDRVPTKSGHGVSTLTLTPTMSSSPLPFSSSLSAAKSSAPTQVAAQTSASGRLVACQPFYLSGAESRRKRLKEKSVGKWARPQDIQERSLDTSDAWSAFKSISIGRNQVQIPAAALPVASSSTASPSPSTMTQDILMISDLEVHQFLEALDQANPGASKIGLLASSTPFITGQPVTMFYDGKAVQDGVLGVSLLVEENQETRSRSMTTTASTTVEYPTLAPLGLAMQITKCRGNIILELDASNATRLLLDQLQATTLTKDKEYFLATGDPTTMAEQGQDVNIDMVKESLECIDTLHPRIRRKSPMCVSKAKVFKITGGDPSKGNMAVDTVHDLNVGQWVQFIHHDKGSSQGHYDTSLFNSVNHEFLRFTATDPNNTLEGNYMEEQQQQQPSRDEEEEVSPYFGGSSENGFIAGQPGEQSWVCNVTESIMKHHF